MTDPPREAAWDGLDVPAILASLQDQIDELNRAVQAQQRTINELTRARGPGASHEHDQP